MIYNLCSWLIHWSPTLTELLQQEQGSAKWELPGGAGVQPPPTSCTCLFVLGVRRNPHRSQLQTLAIFMCNKCQKYYIFLSTHGLCKAQNAPKPVFGQGGSPFSAHWDSLRRSPRLPTRLGRGTPLTIPLPLVAEVPLVLFG